MGRECLVVENIEVHLHKVEPDIYHFKVLF